MKNCSSSQKHESRIELCHPVQSTGTTKSSFVDILDAAGRNLLKNEASWVISELEKNEN